MYVWYYCGVMLSTCMDEACRATDTICHLLTHSSLPKCYFLRAVHSLNRIYWCERLSNILGEDLGVKNWHESIGLLTIAQLVLHIRLVVCSGALKPGAEVAQFETVGIVVLVICFV